MIGQLTEQNHTLPPPPSDPSDNSEDILLRLATLGAEILVMVGHYTS